MHTLKCPVKCSWRGITIFHTDIIIPACTWAIFSGIGTGISIQELERRIITEWLPTSGYEYDNAPDMEVYLNPDPNNMQYEVWIPIKKYEVKA